MPAPETVLRLTFVSARRGRNSANGNPSWSIRFEGKVGEFRTNADASWSYEVSNLRAGDVLEVHFTRAGRIAYAVSVAA